VNPPRVAVLLISGAVAVGLATVGGRAQPPAALQPPTWARDVAPILMNNCVECHRPGQVAPFSLLEYRDAAKRARFLAKTVKARIMPPWTPDGPEGVFLGERRLTDAEIATIAAWADSGAQPGDLALAPSTPPAPADTWHLGIPDLVVRMRRPFEVPAGPADTYQVFPIPFSLAGVPAEVLAKARIPDSDVLAVAAVEIHPGNRRALHHADVFVDTSGAARKREADGGGNGYSSFGTPGFVPAAYLGGRVPGMVPRFLPHGIAASVMPMTGDIALQIHYNATGKVETDQTEVGIYFLREPARRILDSLFLRSFRLDIPAGDPAFTVEDSITVPADCVLMSVFAHMHLVGREAHASARFPDGTSRPLLDISRWNFRWQDRYFYREPFVLPKGTVVSCRWVFDNSEANPSNPFSPPRDIRFGPNSTDEMCELQLGLIPLNLGDESLLLAARVQKMKDKIAELTPEERGRFHWEDAFNDLSGR
jgi:mono/diheme cytochrome c family protein